MTAKRRLGFARALVVFTEALLIAVALIYLADYAGDLSGSRGRRGSLLATRFVGFLNPVWVNLGKVARFERRSGSVPLSIRG